MSMAELIRPALVCPKCKERCTIRAEGTDSPTIALRLICGGTRTSPACGVLGIFEPADRAAWSTIDAAGAIAQLRAFLETAEMPENKNERIGELVGALRQLAQVAHQAYHTHEPEDACDCTWEECPRGICRRAQRALGIAQS